jgi:hypothetical protein
MVDNLTDYWKIKRLHSTIKSQDDAELMLAKAEAHLVAREYHESLLAARVAGSSSFLAPSAVSTAKAIEAAAQAFENSVYKLRRGDPEASKDLLRDVYINHLKMLENDRR